MNFLKKIFLRPVAVCTVAVVMLALGVFSTTQMATNLLPDIAFPALGITVAYPGASAETCDEAVRPLVENSVKTLSNVKTVSSYCIENASITTVLFDYGVDVDRKKDEIKDKFALVQFPDACYDPVFTQLDFNGMAVATVSVYNVTDVKQSYADAEELRKKLLAVENVGSVAVTGAPTEQIVITPVNGLEITTLLIVQALSTDSKLDIPLGTLEQDGKKVAFRNESFAKTVEEIENVPISLPLERKTVLALTAAKRIAEILRGVPADDIAAYRDELKELSVAVKDANLPSAEEVIAAIPFDALTSFFDSLGAEELSSSVVKLKDLLAENEALLDLPNSVLSEIQVVFDKYLTEEFWNSTDDAIALLREREHVNEITGELEIDDLTADEVVELLKIFGVSLPITVNSELVRIVRNADLSDLKYDADGKTSLTLLIGEVAEVKRVSDYSSKAYLNSYPSVTLQVYGISGANTTAISEAVKEAVNGFSARSVAVLLDDQSQFINDSISNVLSSMLIGGALAIIVIYLFLRKVRTSLIIAVTMPLSVLCALTCLYFMGITLNMVSLGGLAVGIGMLVDNSIVVIESISFERDKGKNAVTAAVDGTKLVAGSLIASTLTSVCVFFPILFTKGLSNMIFSDLSYAVIFSLTFSLIVAVTVIPTLYCAVYGDKVMLAGKALESRVKRIKEKISGEEKSPADKVKKDKKHPREPRIMPGLMRFYESFLNLALRHRRLVLLVALAVFVSSVGLVFVTGTEFLPSVDQRTIEVKISFDASDNLAYCEEQTRAVYDDIFAAVPEIKYISASVGSNGLLSSSNSGVIRILLEDDGEKTKNVLEKVREISENRSLTASVTEVDGVLASLMSGLGGFATISATITGDDVETLKEIAQTVREKTLAEDQRFKQVTDNLSDEMLEYVIKIDKAKCLELGVDYSVAVGTLRAGIAGYTACSAEIDGETLNVTVRFREGTVEEYYSGITGCVIGLNGNTAVTVGDVATVSSHYSPTIIKKEGGKDLVTLSAEVSGIDSGSASKIFTDIIAEVLSSYDGYEFQESGVNHYLTEVFDGLIAAMIASFLLLFAVMACQFESLAKPFIVIFAIPFSFTGGFLALVLTGISLNVVSFVGIIMLMGVVVNDAIVMIDRIGQFEAAGMDRYTALIEGSKSRMRAIWMTTLTTVLALVPLALGIGKGSELMQPLGVVVIGGLTLATLVTLLLIPIMYSLVKRVKIPKKGEENPNLPEAAEAPADEISAEETTSEETSSAKATPAENSGETDGIPGGVSEVSRVKRELTPVSANVTIVINAGAKTEKTAKRSIPLTAEKLPPRKIK